MAFATLRCAVSGHDFSVRDTEQGAPVWRCPRCWQTQARERVEDPRPLQKPSTPGSSTTRSRTGAAALGDDRAGGGRTVARAGVAGGAGRELSRLTAAARSGWGLAASG